MSNRKIQILLDKDVVPESTKVRLSEVKIDSRKLNKIHVVSYGNKYRIVDLNGYYYQLTCDTYSNLVKYTKERGPFKSYLDYLFKNEFLLYCEE